MTFPQTAGYYGLQLSESAEALITSLDYRRIFNLLYDVVFYGSMSPDGVERFYAWFEDEIEALSTADKIALIRWLGDRLAFLHTVPVQEVKS